MVGRATGAVLLGVDARVVEVEVDLPGGLPNIAAVGLPDLAVREGIDRIRASLRHSGFFLPDGRIVVNLAPAELRKQGAALDLPIATALLQASGQIPVIDPRSTIFAGELGLDGALRPVRGALALAQLARRTGRRRIVLPTPNGDEASLVAGTEVVVLGGLGELKHLAWGRCAPRPPLDPRKMLLQGQAVAPGGPDLRDVRGQAGARRALEVAAAGGHHLLMSGPPGAGKSMLAQRMPGILPPMTVDEALHVTRIHSAAGLERGLVVRRPFRAPHHGISLAGLTGGGRTMRPGEISLSSHGVLFLDEMTEFRRDALEALRQPLEDGLIRVVRVHGAATFPAVLTLVGSMNPCPCGHLGNPDGRCNCTPAQVRRYRSRLSGPLLDRFDLVVEVPALDPEQLAGIAKGEASEVVRQRVVAARILQRQRFGTTGPECNARMGPAELERFARIGADARRMLFAACDRLGLSARGFDRIRRVARTLSDLEGEESIQTHHIAEAMQSRRPEVLRRD
jgi:magnesium chelatase family protein